MKLSDFSKSDLSEIGELKPEGWRALEPIFLSYIQSPFCAPKKLTYKKKLVAVACAIIHHNVAWLAHIIVHPHFRNRGFGTTITKQLIDELRSKNFETIFLLATELGELVYRKLGFVSETEYLFFKDLKADQSWSNSEDIQAYSNEFKADLIELDYFVSGENRFFRLEEHLKHALIVQKGGALEAIYLRDFGDGLIIAKTAEAGIALMKKRLEEKRYASFPAENKAASNFMQENAFKSYKKEKRMRYGKAIQKNIECIYNRVGGDIG